MCVVLWSLVGSCHQVRALGKTPSLRVTLAQPSTRCKQREGYVRAAAEKRCQARKLTSKDVKPELTLRKDDKRCHKRSDAQRCHGRADTEKRCQRWQ